MILHNVFYCTVRIIKIASIAESKIFVENDLDIFYIFFVPQRFKKKIGKSYDYNVAYKFFPEIMVDAINMRFDRGR